jgi:hypothetical protein
MNAHKVLVNNASKGKDGFVVRLARRLCENDGDANVRPSPMPLATTVANPKG